MSEPSPTLPLREPTPARPSHDALRKRGLKALNRARMLSGGQKVGSVHLYSEIQKMIQDGLRMDEIAFALKRSERYLRMVRADNEVTQKPIPKVTMGRTLEAGQDGYIETRFTLAGFIAFFERFSGKKFPEHAYPWVRAFIAQRNVILNVPPRHAKSTIFSVWVPLWLVCIDRNVQILLISETKEFAKGWATEIAGQMELNYDLVTVFGAFEPDQKGDFPWRPNAGELIVRGRTRHAKGAQLTIQSRGMEQQVLGMEADYVIADDPTNQEIAASDTKRKTDMKHLREQVLTRVEPQITLDDQGNRVEDQGGRAIIIGQRVHLKDMYGELAKQKITRGEHKGEPVYHVESYPAISVWPEDAPDGLPQVLWAARWPYEELMISYERVGGHQAFETMYQQNPMAEGSALIEPAWMESCKDRSRDGYVGVAQEGLNDTARVCSIDPSPSMYNAIIIADVIYDPKNFALAVMEIDRFKGGLHDLVEKIQSAYRRHHFDYFIFEESGFAKWFFEDPLFNSFKDQFKIIKHKTNINKNDREYGLQSLAADVEFNRISFPYGDPEGRRMTDLWASEALEYPEGDSDDTLLATWFIKWNWKKLKPIHSVPLAPSSGPAWSFLKDFRKEDPYANYLKARKRVSA